MKIDDFQEIIELLEQNKPNLVYDILFYRIDTKNNIELETSLDKLKFYLADEDFHKCD